MDVFADVPERLLVKGGFGLRHAPAEIDDPLARRTAGHVHAVHPRLEHIRIGASVRIGR